MHTPTPTPTPTYTHLHPEQIGKIGCFFSKYLWFLIYTQSSVYFMKNLDLKHPTFRCIFLVKKNRYLYFFYTQNVGVRLLWKYTQYTYLFFVSFYMSFLCIFLYFRCLSMTKKSRKIKFSTLNTPIKWVSTRRCRCMFWV